MSKHEPECVYFELLSACDCDRVRRAYQRGREDAAKAVMAVRHEPGCGEDEAIWDYCGCHNQDSHAAAARGESGQA